MMEEGREILHHFHSLVSSWEKADRLKLLILFMIQHSSNYKQDDKAEIKGTV